LANGVKAKEAVSRVAAESGWPRRDVYALAQHIKKAEA